MPFCPETGDSGVLKNRTWHPISKEVYVYCGTDRYAGKAYDMQEVLDIALGWLSNHAR
jgi:hypothetical protein